MRDAKHELLKNTKLFGGLGRKELELIGEATTELTVPAGTVIATEGERGRDAFVILDGSVEIRIDGEVVATAGKDELVGEMALLLQEPRSGTLVTTTEVDLLVIEPGRFDELLDRVPNISRQLVVTLARRLLDADERLRHC